MDDQHFCRPDEPRRKSFVADDYSIQSTNDEATDCKASAVQAGYWKDPFIKHFIKKSHVERRPPEIHRGYYARVQIVRQMVDRFVEVAGQDSAQIVNLGAGFDTLYWRLVHDGLKIKKFVEIDFSSVTAKKISYIMRPPSADVLRKYICSNESDIVQTEHRNLEGPNYFLLGADIRDLKELDERLNLIAGLDGDSPTLFISECVLIYMSSKESSELCAYLSRKFKKACFFNYELVNLDDTFGEMFKKNMLYRGLTLAGVNICSSVKCQNDRFLDAHWTKTKSYLMTEIYDHYISRENRQRIEKLEFLDEKELLTQLLSHYCVIIAVNDTSLEQLFL